MYKVDQIVTARKRNCGKVMFLQVSVILYTVGVPAPGVCLRPGEAGPGGACFQGGLVLGGGRGLVLGGHLLPGGVPGEDPPTPGRLLLRAARILLECILVNEYISNIPAHVDDS